MVPVLHPQSLTLHQAGVIGSLPRSQLYRDSASSRFRARAVSRAKVNLVAVDQQSAHD